MLLDSKSEEEFRRRYRIDALGEYQGVILRLGLKLEWLPHFPPSRPEDYGLDNMGNTKPYRGSRGSRELLLDSTMMGAPAASFKIETYLCHSPAIWGIGVGYCGALQPGIEIGTIIIPTIARIGEGTSRYYGRDRISQPDDGLVKRLAESCRRFGYEPLLGEVFSTDAAFMETPDFIADLTRQGILGIDMETSALFSIATYHGKAAAVVLVVSDKPCEGPLHSSDIPFGKTEAITEDVVKICIETLAG